MITARSTLKYYLKKYTYYWTLKKYFFKLKRISVSNHKKLNFKIIYSVFIILKYLFFSFLVKISSYLINYKCKHIEHFFICSFYTGLIVLLLNKMTLNFSIHPTNRILFYHYANITMTKQCCLCEMSQFALINKTIESFTW